MGSEHRKGEVLPLFETRRAEGRILYRPFAASVFVGIVAVWAYRASHMPGPGEDGRFGWIGLSLAELWFGLYWLLTQALRWNRLHRSTFKDRLSQRYENELPKVDVFVCTANHEIEPPMMVISTVLSVMAYDYPPEKLAVYLSDDGGSIFTFYALLEASRFSQHWIPFCKKFNVEPSLHFLMQKLYEEMENRITTAVELGRIPENIGSQHKGFSQWNSSSTRRDHDTILQILIDGRDPEAKDIEGCALPTLVYLAREKRPQHHHNFKAGSMNALIRVSSEISNGQVILNVDCDMYSNNSGSVRDVLCFFMDEDKGHEIAYVQFPQNCENVTKNDIYGSSLLVEFQGLDGYGGPLYIGTGCFHRRETLCGREFSKGNRIQWKKENVKDIKASADELEARMGLRHGCPVEDVITGLSILFAGWKSVYYNPTRKAFLGVAPTSLDQMLLQHKRWSEAKYGYSLAEFLCAGGTVLGWWNEQRVWLYKRTTSYLFAFVDTILGLFGFSETSFVVTNKVSAPDVSLRYEKELMEFGTSFPMFTVLATLAMINLVSLVWVAKRAVTDAGVRVFETVALQTVLCGVLVGINVPLYSALFFRQDNGKIPSSIAAKSMKTRFLEFALIVTLTSLFWSLQSVVGIRFVIDREECFSHKVEYEGDTVHFSFVVIKSEGSWHYAPDGVDLVVKGPSGDQIHDFRDKTSEKSEFMAHQKGVHHFCFTNKSPYHETIDFDVHEAHFSYYDQHAKDEHINPLLEQISKLEEALYNIQFEQHWLETQTESQAIVNEGMSKRILHKALWESAALIGASVLQVYLLRRLFERKLGTSRV
ncbi:hypothetical protein RHMOL_Rhmol04G0012200 [Rhododendron molle]|uniref:Uncharacterized protein n=1 Tax=Rhododendron molle TaxID=49168 RepID=A0ACC0NY75_RHOML|nr:hypothetical protein RHMOL_Rhmol04G0012200 [Rhododendron molle]